MSTCAMNAANSDGVYGIRRSLDRVGRTGKDLDFPSFWSISTTVSADPFIMLVK